MSLRYFIEASIFVIILFVFQYEISSFNKDLHLAMRELKEFEILNEEIILHGGTPYDPNDPHRLNEQEDSNSYDIDDEDSGLQEPIAGHSHDTDGQHNRRQLAF